MKFFSTLYWTLSSGLRQSPSGSPWPGYGRSSIVQVTQSRLCDQRGKNCLNCSWCLLHCFRWSHFLTNSLASSAYGTLVYVSSNFFPQVLVIWLWVINGEEEWKQSWVCLLMHFPIYSRSFCFVLIEPWIGLCTFWKKAMFSTKQSFY